MVTGMDDKHPPGHHCILLDATLAIKIPHVNMEKEPRPHRIKLYIIFSKNVYRLLTY